MKHPRPRGSAFACCLVATLASVPGPVFAQDNPAIQAFQQAQQRAAVQDAARANDAFFNGGYLYGPYSSPLYYNIYKFYTPVYKALGLCAIGYPCIGNEDAQPSRPVSGVSGVVIGSRKSAGRHRRRSSRE